MYRPAVWKRSMENIASPQPCSHRNCYMSESHAYELQVPVPSTAKLEATACSLCNSLAHPVHPDGNSFLAGVAQRWLAETQCGFEHVCHPTYAESCLASYFLHWAQARTGTCRQHRSANFRLNHAMLAQTYAAEGSQTVVNNSAIYKFLHNSVGVISLLLQLYWPQLRYYGAAWYCCSHVECVVMGVRCMGSCKDCACFLQHC